MARVICESEPTRPSRAIADRRLRIADLKDGGTSSQQTKITLTNPKASARNPKSAIRNSKFFRSDVDNIVLMALRKDPARRYTSVDQFSEDIRRYLAGLPVSARSDTFAYHAAKFVQRNKAACIAAGFFLLALVAGIGATLYQERKAERQRVLAEKRFNEVRELAHSVVFKYHDAIARLPGSTQVRAMLVQDALDYLDRLSRDAGGDRSLQRELALAYLKVADVQGKAYSANVGDTAGAVISSRKAIALFESLVQTAPASEVEARADLRDAYLGLGLTLAIGGDPKTREVVEKAHAISEELARTHPENPDNRLKLARSLVLQSDTSPITNEQHIALFQQAQTIVDELIKTDAGNVDFLAAMGTIHQRLGDHFRRGAKLAQKNEDKLKAAEFFAQSAEHHRLSKETVLKLLRVDPDNNRYQRLFAIARNNYGEALVSVGDAKTAVAEITAAITYFESNAATDPKNLNARYELGLARQALANTLLYAGNKKGAFQQDSSAIKLFESLVKDDTANRDYPVLALTCVLEFGDALMATHDFPEALRQYKASLIRFMNGPNADPRAKVWLSQIHERLGDWNVAMAEESGKNSFWESARTEYQTALDGRASLDDLKKKVARCEKALGGSPPGGSL